ncbi:MAG: phospholipase D-like domain-containing protein [Patescibacteria group bacterium]|nr:phospholipase D-like domain-containing protein [Patescibacteria group bacterium]
MTAETPWKLYISNEETWNDILHDCAKAEKRIVLEQFIFENEGYGRRLLDICAERAAAGVSVKILIDAAGSFGLLNANTVHELKSRGVEMVFWRSLLPRYDKLPRIRSWFLRNHRRTLVIDGHIGYTGSICMSRPFLSWRDTNMRVEGTTAHQMENAFDRMWDRAIHSRPLTRKLKYNGNTFRYMTNYPTPGRRQASSALAEALRAAEKKVFITTPYFVPSHRILRLLRRAARRGADVRIILPKKSDHTIVDIGGMSYWQNMIDSGIGIYRYSGNMIHAKTVTVDGIWSSVGSMNIDRLSLHYNFEANIVSTDHHFAKALEDHFYRDLEHCEMVTQETIERRSAFLRFLISVVALIRNFL